MLVSRSRKMFYLSVYTRSKLLTLTPTHVSLEAQGLELRHVELLITLKNIIISL